MTVYPSGRPVVKHPRGRRVDNPAQPDPETRAPRGLLAQLRVDSVFLVPAPIVGLWWGALRGSDPS